MRKQDFTAKYMWSVIAVGGALLLFSTYRFPVARLTPPFLVLALLVVAVTSRLGISIPRITGLITVSDTLVFLAMLLYGGEPAILLAAADGLCSSLRISRRPRTILFNSAVMASSTFITVWVLRLCFGPIIELTRAGYTSNFISALCVMALTQYAANSGLIAVEKAFKTGRSVWATWKDFYLWTSITYIVGAPAAGLVARLVGVSGFYAVVLTAPLIALIYLSYRTYRQNIETSQAQAAQAAQHVTELSHYITELKRAEEERDRLLVREQQARADAEAANRIKDEFLATLSHELRTPLTSILGWANLLRAGQLQPAQGAQALEAIERNAQNQKRLIDDLLDVSRIITGKLRLDVRPVAVEAALQDAVAGIRPAAAAKEIQLVCLCAPELGPVAGDPSRLQQALWNLLFNAVKFTPARGRIEVRAERVDTHVRISITDTGKGIAPEFLPYVFDRFRQADGGTTRRHGGLGLGLAIVRHLIEAHGGTVHADSRGEGLGATFSLTLPFMAVRIEGSEVGRVGRSLEISDPRARAMELDGLRVLVVDDDDDARQMISAVLTLAGAHVRDCGSAGEALKTLRQWQPDVMMSDIGMPKEDGYDLIRRVRALPEEQGGRVPAAALTAYARADDRARVLAAGYQLHVAKPIGSVELVSAVASLARQAA
jgi:signal transduction histidine kinase/ActR/RegA family two-component response regulator